MKKTDKKSVFLKYLHQETDPLSLIDLIKKLPPGYPERTIRRWLNELVQEGIVEKSGQKKGTKYRVVQRKSEGGQIAISKCFGSESERILDLVKRPIYERQPTTYQEKWLDAYQPNTHFYISAELRRRLLQTGQRSDNQDPAGTYAHQIYNRLLIDLSYNSSRLEGNTYSLLDTERLILQGTGAEGKLDEEKVMILNHKEAIRYLVDNAVRLNVSKQTICTIHYLLSDGLVEPKYAGKTRDHSVRIGGSTYIPLDNSKRLQMLLDRITEKAALIRDPFEQSLFLLIHISYLQAFTDVNKRTARLSANIPLITQNLVPLSFNDVDRSDYMSAVIAIYELQEVRPIVDLYVHSYLRTCAAYDSTVKAMGFDQVRIRYRQQRRDTLQKIILNGLKDGPMQIFIHSTADREIPSQDRAAFIEDILEDLDQIDQSRIAGLGITPQQLDSWIEQNSIP